MTLWTGKTRNRFWGLEAERWIAGTEQTEWVFISELMLIKILQELVEAVTPRPLDRKTIRHVIAEERRPGGMLSDLRSNSPLRDMGATKRNENEKIEEVVAGTSVPNIVPGPFSIKVFDSEGKEVTELSDQLGRRVRISDSEVRTLSDQLGRRYHSGGLVNGRPTE